MDLWYYPCRVTIELWTELLNFQNCISYLQEESNIELITHVYRSSQVFIEFKIDVGKKYLSVYQFRITNEREKSLMLMDGMFVYCMWEFIVVENTVNTVGDIRICGLCTDVC